MSESTATATQTDALQAAAQALDGTKPLEQTQAPVTTEQGEPADDESLGEGGKKALESERTARKEAERERNELKARLDKIEAANMSDLERAQKEATEAKAEVEKVPAMVADHLRDHLATIHNISPEDRELYLTSNDPAVLLKQAAGIAARTTTTPKPDPTQGAQQALALNGDGLTDALSRAVGANP